jgi:hypothetical protein
MTGGVSSSAQNKSSKSKVAQGKLFQVNNNHEQVCYTEVDEGKRTGTNNAVYNNFFKVGPSTQQDILSGFSA